MYEDDQNEQNNQTDPISQTDQNYQTDPISQSDPTGQNNAYPDPADIWGSDGYANPAKDQATENNVYGDMNSYGSGAYRNSEPEKPSRTGAIIFLALGGLLFAAGIFFLLFGGKRMQSETESPVDIYEATHKEQYVFTNIQYLTYSVACYEAMEALNFYIALDEDWNASIICGHDNQVASLEPYYDWLFSDEEEGGPEEISVVGYAQPIDDELKEYVIEEFYNIFDYEISESEFSDFFGDYYLMMGEKDEVYGTSNIGIFLLLGALALLVIGVVKFFGKSAERAGAGNGPIIENNHVGLGILGAFLGACLGGLIWTIVLIMGYVSGWVGFLIMFFAFMGYKLFSHDESTFGVIISFIFGILVVIPATYLAWGWEYYNVLNESISGYTSLMRALLEMPTFMSSSDLWGDFVNDLVQGYVFMGIMGIYWLVTTLRKNR